jgi:glycosyltransferase involved in cell wall biosynthesis
VQNLERLRLSTPAGALKDAIGTAQARLFNARYRSLFFDASGRRRAFLPLERALGHSAQLGPDCTILVAGAEWNTKDPAVIRDLKRKTAYRLVMVCHDLIPILFPQFYMARDAQVFANYYRQAVGFVDRFVSVSHCTARDLARFAGAQAASPDIRVEPPGMKLPTTSGKPHELPRLLTPRRFILFVSTIEPRKNHALLYRAWLRLIECGIVSARGYKLVFVGRPGWHTEPLMAEISADARVADSLVYLREPSDDVLAQLYTDAAFCVYPSIYEGFGLPVAEALAYGRAVIGSTGGSIPEVLGQLGPCLDAADEDAWFATLERFMSDDETVRACEARVRAEFRPITWKEAAARYFQHATDQFDANRKPLA